MKMSRKTMVIAVCGAAFAAVLLLFLALAQGPKFREDGLLAEYRSSPLWDEGQGEWVFYDRVYQVYNDGRRMYFAENFEDGYTVDLPPVVTQLSKKEIEEIQKVIRKKRFMSLPGDLSNYRVMDGGKASITVYTASKSHTCGGNNPMDVPGAKRFSAVGSAIRGEYTEEIQIYSEEVNRILKEQYNRRNGL